MCKLSKRRIECISPVVLIVVLLYGIALIALSILAYIRYQDSLDFIGVVENWSYSPILDLEIKSVTDECSYS
jgi:hypothetical protein